MKVKDLMTKSVITVSKFDSIVSVAKKMKDYDIGFVVVVDDRNEVLGVITDRDIVLRSVTENKIDGFVDDIMTPDCVGISKIEDIKKAVEMMGDYQLKRLVVTDEAKKAIGVLSLSDIARARNSNKYVNETLYEISIPNPQKDKPLKYLEVDDFRL
ncbi:MAG: CBS domain-containing protein [Bacilli bacterium]